MFVARSWRRNWKDIIKMMVRGLRGGFPLAELMVLESRPLSPHFLFTFLSVSFSGKEQLKEGGGRVIHIYGIAYRRRTAAITAAAAPRTTTATTRGK